MRLISHCPSVNSLVTILPELSYLLCCPSHFIYLILDFSTRILRLSQIFSLLHGFVTWLFYCLT